MLGADDYRPERTCGHRYGPREDTPVAMADVLKEHIEQCPEHPLSEAKREIEWLREERDGWVKYHNKICHSIKAIQDLLAEAKGGV